MFGKKKQAEEPAPRPEQVKRLKAARHELAEASDDSHGPEMTSRERRAMATSKRAQANSTWEELRQAGYD